MSAYSNDTGKLRSIVLITLAALVSSMVITSDLWTLDRGFPVIPILSVPPALPNWVDRVFVILTPVSLALLAWRARLHYLVLFISCFLVVLIQDHMRLQPWAYQHLLFGTVAGLGLVRAKQRQTIDALRLIMVCTYVYAAMFKMNAGFFEFAGITFFDFLNSVLPNAIHWAPQVLGWMIPCLELAIGLGLLFPQWRRHAAWGGMLMHLFILLFIVVRLRWNWVIVPWNLAMIALLWLLFLNNAKFSWRNIKPKAGAPLQWLLFLLVGIMPAFHFIGLWPANLSFDLYSYRAHSTMIGWEEYEWRSFLDAYGLHVDDFTDTTDGFRLDQWSYQELRVPMCPERDVHRRLLLLLCDRGVLNTSRIYSGPLYRELREGENISCPQMRTQ